MSPLDAKKHPVIAAIDVLVFVFALLELGEAWFDIGLGLILPEAALQVVTLIMRFIAVWHAGRHAGGWPAFVRKKRASAGALGHGKNTPERGS